MEHGRICTSLGGAAVPCEQEKLRVFPKATGTKQQTQLLQLPSCVPSLGKGAAVPRRWGIPPACVRQHQWDFVKISALNVMFSSLDPSGGQGLL